MSKPQANSRYKSLKSRKSRKSQALDMFKPQANILSKLCKSQAFRTPRRQVSHTIESQLTSMSKPQDLHAPQRHLYRVEESLDPHTGRSQVINRIWDPNSTSKSESTSTLKPKDKWDWIKPLEPSPGLVSKVIDELKRRFVWEFCKDKVHIPLIYLRFVQSSPAYFILKI
ncbi:hypothetical protein BGZ89_003314 [Linnemannia elongata]|nr:hypothetical protein BGZ89_003314 [Linnemannia elongata]